VTSYQSLRHPAFRSRGSRRAARPRYWCAHAWSKVPADTQTERPCSRPQVSQSGYRAAQAAQRSPAATTSPRRYRTAGCETHQREKPLTQHLRTPVVLVGDGRRIRSSAWRRNSTGRSSRRNARAAIHPVAVVGPVDRLVHAGYSVPCGRPAGSLPCVRGHETRWAYRDDTHVAGVVRVGIPAVGQLRAHGFTHRRHPVAIVRVLLLARKEVRVGVDPAPKLNVGPAHSGCCRRSELEHQDTHGLWRACQCDLRQIGQSRGDRMRYGVAEPTNP
jgi:hypothetical protein